MTSRQARLDRFLSRRLGISLKAVKPVLAAGRVWVDAERVREADRIIGPFCHVELDGESLQANRARYVMLNKPAGIVSATSDARHKTVLDLINHTGSPPLHIAGRLDYHSTGLMLLTNDGSWSRRLSDPENNIAKRYRVQVAKPLHDEYVTAFAAGMFFAYEGIVTRPARLEILDEHTAEVVLVEGRYHQIKRMFGRFQNPVLALHRLAIGNLALDPALASGESRDLFESEVMQLQSCGMMPGGQASHSVLVSSNPS